MSVMGKKRKQYTDEQRAQAVAMLHSQGYPDKKGALQAVADYMGVHPRTISRWFNGENNPPPDKLVSEKKAELADVYEGIAYKMLAHAGKDDVIDEMSGKDAVIAAATATDKMRLLRGLPTEIVQIIPDVVQAIQDAGDDPVRIFERLIERARERAELQN